jgi:hypothetical protein
MWDTRILGEELETREPTAADIARLCPEERALVHALGMREAGSGPVNWQALRSEVFRNKLCRKDYERLAKIERNTEEKGDFHTPPTTPER